MLTERAEEFSERPLDPGLRVSMVTIYSTYLSTQHLHYLQYLQYLHYLLSIIQVRAARELLSVVTRLLLLADWVDVQNMVAAIARAERLLR